MATMVPTQVNIGRKEPSREIVTGLELHSTEQRQLLPQPQLQLQKPSTTPSPFSLLPPLPILVKRICQNTIRVLCIQWKKLSTTLPIQLKELFTTFLIMQHLLMNKLTTYRMITLSSHNILDKLLLPSRF